MKLEVELFSCSFTPDSGTTVLLRVLTSFAHRMFTAFVNSTDALSGRATAEGALQWPPLILPYRTREGPQSSFAVVPALLAAAGANKQGLGGARPPTGNWDGKSGAASLGREPGRVAGRFG